jgi:hypothetical protein
MKFPRPGDPLGGNLGLKRGYLVIYAQFGLIVLFTYGLSAEYRSNAYQQHWISNNAPLLQYFLNGYLAAMLLGIFIGGGVLLAADYWRSKNRKSSLRKIG